jgi:hypothetical protein
MYIDFAPNRGSKPAILLRESIREGKRIRKRTLAVTAHPQRVLDNCRGLIDTGIPG